MAKSIEITLTGKLADHVRQQTSEHGLYQDASDYIRALIRKDLESELANKQAFLDMARKAAADFG